MHTLPSIALVPVASMFLATLVSTGCGVDTPAQTPASASPPPARVAEPPTAAELDSDRRMVEKLRGIYERTDAENSFLGDRDAQELSAALATLPADAPALARWEILSRLGTAELRLGHPEPAIEHFAKARDLLPALIGKITEKQANRSYLDLALAWLRMGETQNCVAMHTSESCIFPIGGRGVHTNKQGSQKAYEAFIEMLKVFPNDLTARWLLNIAAMTLGTWPDGVPEKLRIGPEHFQSKEEFPRFVDIAPKLELNSMDLSGGSVIDDFDGDGLLDIVTSTWDTRGAMHYYKNNGDGSFTDRTAEAGLADEFGGINTVQADYDNDGDLDLLVLRGAWLLQAGRHPESLLKNDGTGHFTDVTFLAGVGEVDFPTHSGAFADFDLDGDLDIAIGHESRPESPFPSQLFRNNGDGTFTDIAAAAGTTNLRYAKGVSWGDYDQDRYPDIYFSNLFGENRLYHNNRDGTFSDIAPTLGMTKPSASFPTWWWDFDNDGALDLFVSSWEQDVSKYAANVLGLPQKVELPCLYKGDGKGGFKEVGQEQGLTLLTQPMGSNFGDLDNDGYLDFYLGTGYPGYEALMPNTMYHNLRGKGFADVTTAGAFGNLQKGHGVSFADLDNDGDQDVFEQMGGAFPGDAFGDTLYENPGFGNHWIKLQLVGVESNRCAIGSRIRVVFQENGTERSVYKHVNSGGTFGSNPLRQELGLGKASRIDRIEIYWPKTDKTQVFKTAALDAAYRVREDAALLERIPLRPFPFAH